jgi:hypothetical protein
MSQKPKLLLPSNPIHPHCYGRSSPSNDLPKITIPLSQEITAMSHRLSKREKRHIRLLNSSPIKKTLSRYGAILIDQEGNRHVAKVITSLSMDEWAKKHGYIAERWFRISGEIDADKEKTEVASTTSP